MSVHMEGREEGEGGRKGREGGKRDVEFHC